MEKVSTLKDLKFENTTQLVAYLQNSGLVWKADKNPERIYILDTTKTRNQSVEFVLEETQSGYVYLKEVA